MVLQFEQKASQCICSGGFICQHLCQTSNNPVGALRPACAHRPAAAATMTRTRREAAAAAASDAEAAIQTADHTAFTLPPCLPPCLPPRLQRSGSDDPQDPNTKTRSARRGSAVQTHTWPKPRRLTRTAPSRGWGKRA